MKNVLLWLLMIFVVLSFFTLARNPLLNDDAALYALAAKNAVVHNQWFAQFVTPGDPASFLDKPPLGIWMLAAIPRLTTVSELTVHLPNMVFYTLMLIILFNFLKQFSKNLALDATIITATSLAFVAYSRTPKLDIPLTVFILNAHLMLFNYIKKDQVKYLYYFSAFVALGFLVKSGFGLIVPGLTGLGLIAFNQEARQKLLKFIWSKHLFVCLAIFVGIVGTVLLLQAIPLQSQWFAYLKSITIQSKYNTSYLGLHINTAAIGLLLLTAFPWTPLALTALKTKLNKEFDLSTFVNCMFWPNFLFLLFLFKQTDFRTFTYFVPFLAILAALKARSIEKHQQNRVSLILLGLFFLIIFYGIVVSLLNQPYNHQGIDMKATIIPIFAFIVALTGLLIYYWKPTTKKFAVSAILTCTAYVILFYFTLPIAQAFNPDTSWPGIIKEQQKQGYQFYIYRPHDRNLIMSPDLFYVDFMIGPADQYFWQGDKLKAAARKNKSIILSDTASWKKLELTGKIIDQDSYSSLILR